MNLSFPSDSTFSRVSWTHLFENCVSYYMLDPGQKSYFKAKLEMLKKKKE